MRRTTVSTFGANLTFEDSGATLRPEPEPVGNVCQGCGHVMPLDEEKTYVPGRGSFHNACAPE